MTTAQESARRRHTAECYRSGCTTGAHSPPRPGHVAGGPWTPEEVAGAVEREREAMAAAYAELLEACTCAGRQHDDEADCPVSPECTCGPVYGNVFCPRHGDPSSAV